MTILALGFVSVLVSIPLIPADSGAAHVIGYVAGALVPIVVVGFVRRMDLDRRRSPFYVPQRMFRTAVVALAVLAVIAAGLHVWPLATELAS
ncbi:MAG: hypothetical protein KDB02_03605 [Acidimicrobiales bacterium]|nr:hypothetical protein [Acidimicrobiales bacterium]